MTTLFSDDFNTPGPDVNRSVWTTPTGNAAFFGRTAIRNPDSTTNGSGRITVSDGVAHLLLSTYNPTAWTAGDSFWGSAIDTIESFGFGNGVVGLEFAARVRSPEQMPPGIVTSLFGYRVMSTQPLLHDEIDWEFLSNFYQPGIDPPSALTNHYAAQPFGPGHPVQIFLPSGFDFTDFHEYAIRYYQASGGNNQGSMEWLVDGALVRVETGNLPAGPLSANLNIWAPGSDFSVAYSPTLQPTPNPSETIDYDYQVDWVSVTSTTSPFFDDHDFAAVAKLLPGVIEPAVPIHYNGLPIEGHNHHAVELYDRTPDGTSFPSSFVDLVANTYVRDTYQKPDGSSGQYGTSFAATFSYRAAGGSQDFVYLPTVDRGDITTGGSAKYTDVVSGHFGSVANTTSTRSFADPTFDFTRVGVSIVLDMQQDTALATGAVRLAGDVLRAGTLASMFSTQQQFDASLILWEDTAGKVHSLQLDDATARDAHLFGTAQELGSWIELAKAAGSTWSPDSPTVRLVISNPHGLRLGVQGFLASSLNPNDDSLSVWPELLDPPNTLQQGSSYSVDFEVIAVAPLADNTTYVTPFSAQLDGTPFSNVSLIGTANISAVGNDQPNVLEGNSGSNRLDSGAGDDALNGGNGNDTLNGGSGADTMSGGDGRDYYYVDNAGDVVIETNVDLATGGNDLMYSYLYTYTLTDNVERLRLLTPGSSFATGNSLDNILYAGDGNNVMNGAGGNDTVSYAYASSAVSVNLAIGKAQATGGSGTDTLISIENLGGSNFDDDLRGNDAANELAGGNGNDTLNGSGGADTLIGGNGTDYYYVDDAGDVVIETNANLASGGNDLVYSYLYSYTLTDNVERLRLLTTGSSFATGNGLDNILYAGDGNNVMNGGDGNDTVSYAYANSAVNVSLAIGNAQATGGSGIDTLQSIENLAGSNFDDWLRGDGSNNVLEGGDGNDSLNGEAGADTMSGGDGSDYYYVDDVGDVVVETNASLATGGNDLVYSYLQSYTLTDNVERLRLLITGSSFATGNSLDNILYAGDGNNVMNGAGGNDTVSYAYAASAVSVNLGVGNAQATGGSGIDTLQSIENLAGSNYNDWLRGDGGNNVLEGGDGNDSLNGEAGADTLIGGNGTDYYYVDDAGDVVVETNANLGTGGNDLVYSYLYSYTLTDNVERLRLLTPGSSFATGNSLDNTLYAGDGNNVMNGAAGNDTVSYAYATSAVSVNLALGNAQTTGGSGIDTLQNVENLAGSNFNDNLRGNNDANRLDGAAGNDTLNGSAGADTMSGGDGTDYYYIDDAGDVVVETNASLATGGNDLVYSYIYSYTLTDNVERLRVLTPGSSFATGNGLDNILYAGDGNNVMNGGAGNDTVSYAYATSAVDVTLALTKAQATGGSGTDTLKSIENLAGSNFNDRLTGNDAANRLEGGNGNDTLNGGLGNDTLSGGAGSDTIRFDTLLNALTNCDTITDFNVVADSIELENAIFAALTSTGTLAAGSFRAGAGVVAADGDDFILYDTASGALLYDADGNGAGTAVQFATLSGGLALSNADFFVT